jgi:hypothetical protein
MVTFSIGVAILTLAIRPMGMTIGRLEPRDRTDVDEQSFDAPRSGGVPAVPKIFVAIALVAAVTLVLSVADFGLRSYNLVATASGEPKLLAFRSAPAAPEGWRFRVTDEFSWAKPLFGDDSTWIRYTFVNTGGGDLHSPYGVTADIIDTSDLQTFSAYGVEACYQFHGFALQDVAQADIGGGITGQTLSFTGPNDQSWSVVYWIVPVKAGQGIRYERFVLYLLNVPGGTGVQISRNIHLKNVAGSLQGTESSAVLIENRAFLVDFAHELIVHQALRTALPNDHLAVGPPAHAPSVTPTKPSALAAAPRDAAAGPLHSQTG